MISQSILPSHRIKKKKKKKGTVAIMLHFVWKLWDKSATGVIKVEAIQLVWGPVIYPLFPCQLSSSSLSVVIFIDRRREPRQKKSLQQRACGPGLFYLCLNPIQVRCFHCHEFWYNFLSDQAPSLCILVIYWLMLQLYSPSFEIWFVWLLLYVDINA